MSAAPRAVGQPLFFNFCYHLTMEKLVAIVGPTASGKTDLAKKLVQKFNGEVISVDSRQVYKGLDIGTGKDKSFKQHLIDIKEPQENFSVAEFQKLTLAKIKDIQRRGKLPFLVGGTGYYLDSVLFQTKFPKVKPDLKLRQKLEKWSSGRLQKKLNSLDKTAAQRAGLNKRRLIRALEIVFKTGHVVPILNKKSRFGFLILGLDLPREELYQRIDKKVEERFKVGIIEEARGLLQKGVAKNWLEGLGLEYRFVVGFLDGKYTQKEMIQGAKSAVHAFARRQLTWTRRYPNIKWIKTQKQAEKEVNFFLGK